MNREILNIINHFHKILLQTYSEVGDKKMLDIISRLKSVLEEELEK